MGLNHFQLRPKASGLLSLGAKAAVMLWLMAQIAVIITCWGAPQFSDAANYARFAYEAVAAHAIYPTAEQFHNDWVANTGYINFLVLNLYIFGTLDFVPVQQLLLNCLLLWSIRKLALRFGNSDIANFAVVIFCLLPSNVMDVQTHMSDLFCCAVFIWSIVLMRSKAGWLMLAGAVAAIANWARPVGLIFWPSVLIAGLMICHDKHFSRGRTLALAASYIAGVVAVGAIISASTYASCGYPLHGSTTKGTNMIIGCNDKATGEYNDIVFQPGEYGYVDPSERLNAVQRDKELTRRSIEWIMANPVQFLKIAPAKVFRLWCGDFYSNKVLEPPVGSKTPLTAIGLWSLTYYIALLLAIVGIWKSRRNLLGYAGVILLPLLLGTGMHLLMYGGMRYHYPMMASIYFFAAVGAVSIVNFGKRFGELKRIA